MNDDSDDDDDDNVQHAAGPSINIVGIAACASE
jgi:hypothetical protein